MKKLILFLFVFVALLALLPLDLSAQCAMCRAAAEQSLESGAPINLALGLNKGILYLLIMPYVLFSGVFLTWYFHYKQNNKVVTH